MQPAFLLVVLLFSTSFSWAKSFKSLIQRAYVTQSQAIVYKAPDFDSEQAAALPRDRVIAISTKIYRPKNLFGSFYRVFVNKPYRIRGYISEVDVIPQFKKTKKGLKKNPKYAAKEKALRLVKDRSIIQGSNTSSTNSVKKPEKTFDGLGEFRGNLGDTLEQEEFDFRQHYIGATLGQQFFFSEDRYLFFTGVHWLGIVPKFNIPMDVRFSFSLQPPVSQTRSPSRNRQIFTFEGHVFSFFPVAAYLDRFILRAAGGFAWKHNLTPKIGPGIALSSTWRTAQMFAIGATVEYDILYGTTSQSYKEPNVFSLWLSLFYLF